MGHIAPSHNLQFWVVGVVRNTPIFKMYKGVDMGKIYKRNFQSSGWSTIR